MEVQKVSLPNRRRSSASCLPESGGKVSWSTEDFIRAHRRVKESGLHNFQGCKIPIPTAIRYDRIEAALGPTISPKELQVINLLKYGMPLNCDANYGIKKTQKNHLSALNYKEHIDDYMDKNVKSQAMLGPFIVSPIPELRFSPMLTVPKDESKRRVVVDFSFPPGRSVNDGIPKTTYLDGEMVFSLPAVQLMVS